MTQELKTKIDGYDVILQLYEECGEPRSDCLISKRSGLSASLNFLSDTGALENYNTGHTHVVHPQTIRAIEAWAEENGY